MQLPQDLTPADFHKRYRHELGAWRDAIVEVGSSHGVPTTNIEAFVDGSNLIASVADRFVIKIFPPFHRDQWESERRALGHLWEHGLEIPIPNLIAQGVRDDNWSYVILSRLSGVTLESIWPTLSLSQKAGVMAEIGKIMAQVHSVPVAGLHDLEPRWAPFLRLQAEQCRTRHQRLGMPAWFLDEVESHVAAGIESITEEKPVLLTGEYTPFNLLMTKVSGQWRISGMIDFGDVMVGNREYDFLGPCLFLGEGRAELIDSLFDGYRYASPRKDEALRNRLMLLAILHRYSNLKFQIRIDAWENRAQTFLELERLVFGLTPWPSA